MAFAKEIKYLLLNTFLTTIIYYLLCLYAKTLRLQLEDTEKIQKHLENGGQIIFPVEHQRFLAASSFRGFLSGHPAS